MLLIEPSYAVVPILAIVAAASSIYSLAKGISQDAKAKKMEKENQRPSYTPQAYKMPPEVEQYLAKAKMQALDQKLPGQDVMEERIRANTANTVAATQQSGASSAEILNSLASIQKGENRAMNDLNLMAAEDMIRKQGQVDNALMTQAQYKDREYQTNLQNQDKAFQVNQYDPYKEKAAAISALKGAGQQNIYGGIEGLSSIAMTQMQYGQGNQRTKPPVTGQSCQGVPMQSAGQPVQIPQSTPQDYYRAAVGASSVPYYDYNGAPYRPEYGQPLNTAAMSNYYPRANYGY